MAQCRSCKAEIIWTLTKTGKLMPLDAKPLPAFSIAELPEVEHRADIAGRAVAVSCYVSHFATCPNAAEHRKG